MTRVNYLTHCDPCGGKQLYLNRRAARTALRILYPSERGVRMKAYPCPHNTTGCWHIGHRPGINTAPLWPAWAETAIELRCDWCDIPVRVGQPVAYTRGDTVCLDCGEQVEHEVAAYRNNLTPPTVGESS